MYPVSHIQFRLPFSIEDFMKEKNLVFAAKKNEIKILFKNQQGKCNELTFQGRGGRKADVYLHEHVISNEPGSNGRKTRLLRQKVGLDGSTVMTPRLSVLFRNSSDCQFSTELMSKLEEASHEQKTEQHLKDMENWCERLVED